MGSRGPLPDATSERGRQRARLGRVPGTAVVERGRDPHPAVIPEPPADLVEPDGIDAWACAWEREWAHESDRRTILHLARLEQERAVTVRAVDQHGPVLWRPVVTPRGDVAGQEAYANPAVREVRRLDAAIAPLRAALGLSPLSRARLGQAVVDLHAKENAFTRLRAMREGTADDA